MTPRELFDAARALIGKEAVVFTNDPHGMIGHRGTVIDVAGHAPGATIDVTLSYRDHGRQDTFLNVFDVQAWEGDDPLLPAVTLDDAQSLVTAVLNANWRPGLDLSTLPSESSMVALARAVCAAGWGPTDD
jgi:hypothetical protein